MHSLSLESAHLQLSWSMFWFFLCIQYNYDYHEGIFSYFHKLIYVNQHLFSYHFHLSVFCKLEYTFICSHCWHVFVIGLIHFSRCHVTNASFPELYQYPWLHEFTLLQKKEELVYWCSILFITFIKLIQ